MTNILFLSEKKNTKQNQQRRELPAPGPVRGPWTPGPDLPEPWTRGARQPEAAGVCSAGADRPCAAVLGHRPPRPPPPATPPGHPQPLPATAPTHPGHSPQLPPATPTTPAPRPGSPCGKGSPSPYCVLRTVPTTRARSVSRGGAAVQMGDVSCRPAWTPVEGPQRRTGVPARQPHRRPAAQVGSGQSPAPGISGTSTPGPHAGGCCPSLVVTSMRSSDTSALSPTVSAAPGASTLHTSHSQAPPGPGRPPPAGRCFLWPLRQEPSHGGAGGSGLSPAPSSVWGDAHGTPFEKVSDEGTAVTARCPPGAHCPQEGRPVGRWPLPHSPIPGS